MSTDLTHREALVTLTKTWAEPRLEKKEAEGKEGGRGRTEAREAASLSKAGKRSIEKGLDLYLKRKGFILGEKEII